MNRAQDSIALPPVSACGTGASAFRLLVKRVVSTLHMHLPGPDSNDVRKRCIGLLADVPGADRDALVQRFSTMRRVDDMQHLRGAFFDVISHFHGEATARERISDLDRSMRLSRVPAPGAHNHGRSGERRSRKS